MRKCILFTIAAIFMTLGAWATDYTIALNLNYNHGVSDFFTKVEKTVMDNGEEFLESRENAMGYGLGMSLTVPVYKKFFVVPGISIAFGNQKYNYLWQSDQNNTGDKDVKKSYFFKIFSGEISLMYCLLPMDNGWNINLLGGLDYNKFTSDAETLIEDQNYLGMHVGMAARFFQQKHLGFQVLVMYRTPFAADMPGFLSARAGFLYKFTL